MLALALQVGGSRMDGWRSVHPALPLRDPCPGSGQSASLWGVSPLYSEAASVHSITVTSTPC